MENRLFLDEAHVALKSQIMVRDLEPNLHAFKKVLITEYLTAFKRTKQAPTFDYEVTGFVDEKNLKRILAGKDYSTIEFRTASSEVREKLRTIPFFRGVDGADIGIPDPFANDFNIDDLVFYRSDDFTFRDRHGAFLPVAQEFDYIHARMDNVHYDLKKVVELLSNRNDITFVSDDHEVLDDKFDFIQQIPSYNATENRWQCLRFYWAPTTDDYRKVMAKVGKKICETGVSPMRFFWAAEDLDILGLRAGGAALRKR